MHFIDNIILLKLPFEKLRNGKYSWKSKKTKKKTGYLKATFFHIHGRGPIK